MGRAIRNVLVGVGAIAALLLLAGIIVTLRTPAPKSVPLPSPNGYDDFVKAALLVCDETADHDIMNEEKLRATVAKNAEALRLARTGLTHESRVPLASPGTNEDTHFENLARLKRLAHAFAAEEELAEMEHRSQDVTKSCLDTIRLGHECSRGGTIIDSLVGIAIESIGLSPLQKLGPNLDAKQCREIATALQNLESGREPVQEILEHEKSWARARFGWKTPFLQLIGSRQTQAAKQKYVGKMANIQTRTGRLAVDFAVRAYELEHGEKPKRVEDLVPSYLEVVPRTLPRGRI